MSYIVTKTDGTTLTTIVDGTKDDTSSSLSLLGRNYSNYGQLIANDFVWLLENFSYETSPSNPLQGQLWWKRDDKLLKVYTGTAWKTISSATSSTTAPSTTTAGDIWWDSLNQQLYVYNGTTPYSSSAWILVGPDYSSQNGVSGAVWENIQDTSSSNHHVLSIYLDGVRTGIISTDNSFTPMTSIAGFVTIQKGYNIRSSDTLWGTANNSSYLGSQPPSKYFRNDIDNITSGNIVVLSDNGITLGSTQQLYVKMSGSDAYIRNTVLNADIYLTLNVAGNTTNVLVADGATGLLTITGDPTTNLGVATKQYVDNKLTNTSLVGIPLAPTMPAGTANTSIATTAFVSAANVVMKSYVDLNNSNIVANVNLKSNINSPTFTGTPQAPTPTAGDNSTNIATTAFITSANTAMRTYSDSISALKANIANPTFTGTPQAPTPTAGTADATIATTAFVSAANVVMTSYVDAQIGGTGTNVNLKANIASPTFTGVPLAPTMPAGTANTSIATTAFVSAANVVMKSYVDSIASLKANIASPTFTGVPLAPTMPAGTANTSIATTDFVINNSGFLANKIYQANSYLQILDTGTGSAQLSIDGTQVLSATSSGVALSVGSTAYTWDQTVSNTAIATTSYVRTAATKWDGSAKYVSASTPDTGTGSDGDFWFQYQ